MKWSDDYRTGVPQLDRQHKILFTMADDYGDSLRQGHGERTYDVLLKFLARYAATHFEMEDSCMHRFRCPASETNRAAHSEFLRVVTNFKQRYAMNGFERSDAEQLVQFMDEWLRTHIAGVDVQLRPCVDPAADI